MTSFTGIMRGQWRRPITVKHVYQPLNLNPENNTIFTYPASTVNTKYKSRKQTLDSFIPLTAMGPCFFQKSNKIHRLTVMSLKKASSCTVTSPASF